MPARILLSVHCIAREVSQNDVLKSWLDKNAAAYGSQKLQEKDLRNQLDELTMETEFSKTLQLSPNIAAFPVIFFYPVFNLCLFVRFQRDFKKKIEIMEKSREGAYRELLEEKAEGKEKDS